MGKRHGWIAVALISLVGGKALAQQTYPPESPEQREQPGPQQADPGMQDSPAHDPSMQHEPDMDAQQQQQPAQEAQPMQQPTQQGVDQGAAGDADKAARRSQLQSEGVRLSRLDQQQITELQRALQQAGYYQGEVDGVVGPQTRRALRQFYSDQAQLAAQGMILPQGAAALGMDEAEIERVRGEDQGQAGEPQRTPGATDTDDTGAMEDMPDTGTQQRQPASPTPSPGAPDPAPPTSPDMRDTPGTMP